MHSFLFLRSRGKAPLSVPISLGHGFEKGLALYTCNTFFKCVYGTNKVSFFTADSSLFFRSYPLSEIHTNLLVSHLEIQNLSRCNTANFIPVLRSSASGMFILHTLTVCIYLQEKHSSLNAMIQT